jgi:ferredoxin
MDLELAELFEAYFQELQRTFALQEPAIHRVIPVEEAIAAEVEVYSYERASALLDGAKAWGVRDCICRVQQKLIDKGCDSPVENCLVFAPIEGVFDHSKTTRAISREEAKRILHEAEDAGLVHSPGNYQDGNSYICNCCTCCCGVLRSVAEFSIPSVVAKSDFYLVVDGDTCAGCGDCLERCQFGALSIPEDVCVVDVGRCVGCGLCVTVCPSEALRLERRAEGEIPPPPATHQDWTDQRARARGLA